MALRYFDKALGEDYQFKVGEYVYIDVDDVNHPTGLWEGEIIAIEYPYEDFKWPKLKVKITDPRILSCKGYEYLFNKEFKSNCQIFPRNTFVATLFRRINLLQQELVDSKNSSRIREEAYKSALVAITEGHAAAKANAAYQQALKDLQNTDAKSVPEK